MCNEEEKDMLAQLKEEVGNDFRPRRSPKNKRTDLLSSTTPERLEMINRKTMKTRGLSNLTFDRVYGEE